VSIGGGLLLDSWGGDFCEGGLCRDAEVFDLFLGAKGSSSSAENSELSSDSSSGGGVFLFVDFFFMSVCLVI
jgi:hypothetical protein